ncbi:hypothetical protein K503DRAFT_805595 [Rhizopogon vinicolor AM-OR11-026]|uniref:Uncharacterized protein n=1 Tax=Rhizopogon vinicolor AM-OR11-026 TaxID=1314800 RepID=A0A1B7MHE4_9AGAM|nr:hypothetical protein K503DRAFT_805595 [Rhizopogon vinicolor AM-OR11-026]
MSRLASYLSNAARDTVTPVVESYPLSELSPSTTTHTYPPSPQPATSVSESYQVSRPAVTAQTYPPQYGEDVSMDASNTKELYNPWQSPRRLRDDEEERPTKVIVKEVNESAKLRADVRGLHAANQELFLRKRHEQVIARSREHSMQSIITQYQQQYESLQRDKVDALSSLNQDHRTELAEFENKARMEQANILAEQDAMFQREGRLVTERLLAEKEAELARLIAQYSCKITSLDSQIQQANMALPASLPSLRHLVGKRPVATHTNIVGFSPIPDASSESDTDREPEAGSSADAGPPLSSLFADIPIQNATVGMLAEALAKTPQISGRVFH